MGLAKAGTWMNTGEGGLSEYHLKGNGDIIYQIGPGLFGVRDHDGNFNRDMFINLAEHNNVRAFEIKLAQGAKHVVDIWRETKSQKRLHALEM